MPTCSSTSPKNRALLAFRVNQGTSASFSLLLSYRRLRITRFPSQLGLSAVKWDNRIDILRLDKFCIILDTCAGVLSCFSCVRLCNPMDCSLPGFSVHGMLQAGIWSGLPCLPPGTHISCVSCIAGGFFTAESLGKPLNTLKSMFILLGKYENVLSELLITSHQSETIVLYQ